MRAAEARRAVATAMSTASALGLAVDDAVVLNDSNRLVVRLTPCDIVARVTPMTHFASAEQEVELVRRLTQTDSPVAALEARVEPRVFVRDGFKITMWTYFEPVRRVLPPTDYAQALERLHAGLRQVDVTTPHVMDRVAETQRDVASRDVTPDLAETDRALLANTLRDLRRIDRRPVRRRAAAARRAAPVERAQHEERAALHRLREHRPWACRVRPCVGARRGQRALSGRRPRSGRRVPRHRPGDHRNASLESRRPTPQWQTVRCGVPRRAAGGSALPSARHRVAPRASGL